MTKHRDLRQQKQQLRQVKVEVAALAAVQGHPGVSQLLHAAEDEQFLYFVLEPCVLGVDLLQHLTTYQQQRQAVSKRLKEVEAKALFMQMCEVVSYCHSRGVVHHDLKLENFLVTEFQPPSIKLINFGHSCFFKGDKLLSYFRGTMEQYAAPEILAGSSYDGFKTDAYALGVILYVMLTGCFPFVAEVDEEEEEEEEEEDLDLQFQQQTSMVYLSSLHYPPGVSEEAKDLVLSLLHPNPAKRISLQNVLGHEFFQSQDTEEEEEEEQACFDQMSIELVPWDDISTSGEENEEEYDYEQMSMGYI